MNDSIRNKRAALIRELLADAGEAHDMTLASISAGHTIAASLYHSRALLRLDEVATLVVNFLKSNFDDRPADYSYRGGPCDYQGPSEPSALPPFPQS